MKLLLVFRLDSPKLLDIVFSKYHTDMGVVLLVLFAVSNNVTGNQSQQYNELIDN